MQKKKKEHNNLLYLGKDKLYCIEMLVSQSITDLNITPEKLKAILNGKKRL